MREMSDASFERFSANGTCGPPDANANKCGAAMRDCNPKQCKCPRPDHIGTCEFGDVWASFRSFLGIEQKGPVMEIENKGVELCGYRNAKNEARP